MIIKKQKTIVELEEDEVAILHRASAILADVCDAFTVCDDCPLKEVCPTCPSPSSYMDDWVYALT